MESKIKKIFSATKVKDNTSGDCVISGSNVEIKVSLGDSTGGYNFVQLRPSHNIDYYIFLVYDVKDGEFGKYYLLLIPESDMIALIKKYGHLAHGTKKKLGGAEDTDMTKTNNEYAIRCNPHKNGKPLEIWNVLKKYNKTIPEIKDTLETLEKENTKHVEIST